MWEYEYKTMSVSDTANDIDVSEYYEGDPAVHVSVHVTNVSGDVVTAVASASINSIDFYEARASSRRDPSDPVNDEIGIKLAVGRAIRQLGRDILKEGQYGVREQDRVRQTQVQASERAFKRKVKRMRELKKSKRG